MYFRPTILDLPFTSADQFITSDTLRPLKDWTSTKKKNFKTSSWLEINQAISISLYCSKQFLITVFEILCIFFFLLKYFLLFFVSKFWINRKNPLFCQFRARKLPVFWEQLNSQGQKYWKKEKNNCLSDFFVFIFSQSNKRLQQQRKVK